MSKHRSRLNSLINKKKSIKGGGSECCCLCSRKSLLNKLFSYKRCQNSISSSHTRGVRTHAIIIFAHFISIHKLKLSHKTKTRTETHKTKTEKERQPTAEVGFRDVFLRRRGCSIYRMFVYGLFQSKLIEP